MESIYELAFPHINLSLSGDTFVKCPFKHTLQNGQKYYDETPSLSINVEKGIHHCFGCGAKGNELQFLAQYMDIGLDIALELYDAIKNSNETLKDWIAGAEKTLHKNEPYLEILQRNLGINMDTIKKLHIGLEGPGRGVAFPVFVFDKLVDVITYNPGKTPKYLKRTTSKNGFIMPYDDWRNSMKPTTICAGQKDLAIALTHDINAITITGGEGNLPQFFYREFEDRIVHIIYDNDEAGRNGAIEVAVALKPYAKMIKIIDISPVCVEKGEDLWDFFMKYHKTKIDLIAIINNTKEFSEDDYQIEKEKIYPTISLTSAMQQQYHNKIVRSNVQVVAVDEEKFLMPTSATATKIAIPETPSPAANRLGLHEKRYWSFKIEKGKDLFYLIDGNINETAITKNLKAMMHLDYETYVSIAVNTQEPVYKCTVTDHIEAFSLEDTITEFTAYSVKHKLESGKKYKVTYKLIPHPTAGSVLTMVIFDVEESQDSVSSFKITENTKKLLDIFKVKQNLKDTITEHVERVKGIVNADYENLLIKIIDLFYHTPLQFKAGTATLRAYLDTLIVAESRVGKTTTVQALQKTYGLGIRVPLNGHNASIAGIIGGSHKTARGFQIRAGVVPRSHKGAVIFEELAKAKNDLLRELTEIRSSSMVAISRVSGTFHMPAFVRMLSLTNARTNGATPKPIASYPNGIEILIDLVGTAEDIARYDIIGVLPGRQNYVIDPFFTPMEPYALEAYQARIRWAWSRSAEQVTITKDIYQYAIQKANIINKDFESYIKIFGPETHLKLIRLAIALACYTVSTDAHYENVIVSKEHLDYAAEFMMELYDNDTFRLRQFVHAEKQYREVTQENIETLQKMWGENQTILLHLENHSTTAQKNLQTLAGMDSTEFNSYMSRLVKDLFVRFDAYDIVPTERFRRCMQQIDKTLKNRYLKL